MLLLSYVIHDNIETGLDHTENIGQFYSILLIARIISYSEVTFRSSSRK